MITFVLHGYEGVNPALEFGPLQDEFERQGFACRIIRSPRERTRMPNQDRARAMVEALRDVEGEIVLAGISNQGLFMPLVAAARPVRRIVMINAVMPFPGQSFLQGSKGQHVWSNWITHMLARRAPGMNEVSPLVELPRVEYVYICGESDDAIRPAWEQWAAREYLHVEPVVVKGAGHANIVLPPYASQVVAAATQGLQADGGATTEASDVPTAERQGGMVRDITPPQRVNQWYRLVSIAISLLAPLITYFAIRPHASGDTEALALAWFIPVAWTLGASLWLRRLDVFGLLGVIAYSITLAFSIVFGAGALPLKLHHALVGGAIGLVCLGSVAIGKPIFVPLIRRAMKRTRQGAVVEAALANPQVVKRITNLTLLVGVVALANAVLQTFLAIALSTSVFLLATTAVHVATIAVIAVVLIVFLWVRAGSMV